MRTPFMKRPVFALRAERSHAQIEFIKVGFYPVREPDASFTLPEW
jgi:hypothetical protein